MHLYPPCSDRNLTAFSLFELLAIVEVNRNTRCVPTHTTLDVDAIVTVAFERNKKSISESQRLYCKMLSLTICPIARLTNTLSERS